MEKIKIEKLFIIIGLIVGCLFIYIIPPFQSPDEDSHFKKAYYIASGNFYKISEKNINGLKIPDTMNFYISTKLDMMGNLKQKYSYNDLYYETFLPSDFSIKSVYNSPTEDTTPIAHIIPAIGILTAKVTGLLLIDGPVSTIFMLQFARFFSLIAYLMIGYFAIKLTPNFKKSMFTILLMPMSIFLGSMVSYDFLMIGISLLTVSLILRLIYDKEFTFNKKCLVALTVTGYILLNIKIVYFPLFILLLFVPHDKFKNKNLKSKTINLIKLFALIIFFTILLKIPNMLMEEIVDSSLSSKQINFVVGHPFQYIWILISNIKSQLAYQLYWMIGNFGLLDTYLPPLFAFICFANIMIVFITDGINEKVIISIKRKLLILAIFILGIVLMYTAMYIYWTPNVLGVVGEDTITGIQGRYFIPLLILLPLLCTNKYFKSKKRIMKFSNNYFDKSLLLTITCLAISIVVCITRYWC